MTTHQPPRRPIRIGNASGAIGDGIDQVYKLANSGCVDAIAADYLAEFNIAWKAIERQTRPELGYEPNFLEQLAWQNGDAARLLAEKKIKVVHNGGALNPTGLAQRVDEYFRGLGITSVKVAAVTGDDVSQRLKDGGFGTITHLNRPEVTLAPGTETNDILAANVYTGQAGIVAALQAGADVVICGRCCDASTVMGLATWWHGWKPAGSREKYHRQLAGSLMAGHLIECGAYVTGGNFCGAREIPQMHHLGYPIAEIDSDGGAIITKPPGTGGAVTVDTCKGQLLYEIQGPVYLNADVVADIEHVHLEQLGPDRVRLSGVRGLAPPPTAKLAVCLRGGYQAEMTGFCAGLDTDWKFELMKDQILREIRQEDFTTFSIVKFGSSRPNPRSQNECTVGIRMFAQARHEEAFDNFRKAIFYSGMQGYCGLHLSMDWRTMAPKMFIRYFPSLVPQHDILLTVHIVSSGDAERNAQTIKVKPLSLRDCSSAAPHQRQHTAPPLSHAYINTSSWVTRPFGDLVFARSGDKGGNANVGFWVRDAKAWPWLRSFLSSEKLIELLADDWDPSFVMERCEFVGLHAVHFVVKDILQDGVSSSSVIDGFAKSFGEFLRARHVQMPKDLVEDEDKRRDAAMRWRAKL
ncbi:uncharacterized protein B0I36DRAFT_291615 [Microdochium trichocladiopsis]|uniref:DUF1446-domain-containing protein n=1 Tax=Microdochium trichocladiopsis TaxID=1682393 RepID=A0A9P8Y848_9PEZI|nr:uncharacterized protein B0I36DRAFT_291615 [Microdochium trichocladiopsis]KAH7029842.1 hypothetical protein B0I36DRAFT_291615 [Microdochium trichocladiopsis]